MFKLVLFLSLKYFFYYKDPLESLLLELKISQKRREAAAHLSSPFPVSTAVPEESEPGQMCPCCFSHGQAWQVGSVPASLALEFGWSLQNLHSLSCSLLWYPQHSYVQMQSKFVTSFGFLVSLRFSFGILTKSRSLQCGSADDAPHPMVFPNLQVDLKLLFPAWSKIQEDDVQKMSGIKQRSSNILYKLYKKGWVKE